MLNLHEYNKVIHTTLLILYKFIYKDRHSNKYRINIVITNLGILQKILLLWINRFDLTNPLIKSRMTMAIWY